MFDLNDMNPAQRKAVTQTDGPLLVLAGPGSGKTFTVTRHILYLLEQGVPPIEAALQTGFSDQSHFTNYFNRFIGLAPGIYRDIFLDKDMEEVPHER